MKTHCRLSKLFISIALIVGGFMALAPTLPVEEANEVAGRRRYYQRCYDPINEPSSCRSS